MAILLNPELERRISGKVESGLYGSPEEVVRESLDLLEARDAKKKSMGSEADSPAWETVVSLGREVPEDEWARVPADLSKNVDHYLYGGPKAAE